MPHKISLILPGLCGPIPAVDGLEASAAPLLELLQPLRKRKIAATDEAGLLADLFGLTLDAPFPYAALASLSFGLDPGDSCWLHADPVNLQADMQRAVLSDAQTLRIRDDEAEQLVEQINSHFAEDGLGVTLADANNWFLRLDHCDLQTTPLKQAVGRNINPLLPTGEDANAWKRILNEVQMLMHMSAVNQQREQRGLPAINSLWFWGEGRLPQPGHCDLSHVYADDAVTTGLARLGHITHSPLTGPLVLADAMKHDGHSLVSLQQLGGPVSYGDATAWLESMRALVEDWLQPLIDSGRRLNSDISIYPCNGLRYHLRRNNKFELSKLMFWKKDRLQDHVDTR